MAKRPGHVDVVTEVGFCNFCNRTRNLRREEHRLGGLVRTILSCETCHRTLSSTMGVAGAQPEVAPEAEQAAEPAAATATEDKPRSKRAPAAKASPAAKKPAAKKPAAKKPAATKKAASKPRTPPKPRSPGTRKSTSSR